MIRLFATRLGGDPRGDGGGWIGVLAEVENGALGFGDYRCVEDRNPRTEMLCFFFSASLVLQERWKGQALNSVF